MAEDHNGTQRMCDGCTLCCYIFRIDVEGRRFKEAFAACRHCTVGVGCEIHLTEKQPDICRRYRCAWREGLGREHERPDATGVVPEWKYTRFGKTLFMFGSSAEALDSPSVQAASADYAREQIPVLHVYPDNRRRMFLKRDVGTEPALQWLCEIEGIEAVFVEARP